MRENAPVAQGASRHGRAVAALLIGAGLALGLAADRPVGDGGGADRAHAEGGAPALQTARVVAEVAEDGLGEAARRAGVPPRALEELVRLLSWGVDLQRDVRPGDRFELLVERATDARGRPLRHEGVAYAALSLRDRRVEAYRFTDDAGGTGYFDREGRSLKRWLLRTPVDGARLSSTFGRRRHPVLGYTRMHKGIDFAAPAGTPVLAAADGVVEFAGTNKGYGRYVRLRHDGTGYGTAYAHLSRIAPGLGRGRRVRQGEEIGRVGSTGLATGPHLHYEVLKGGAQVDPLGLDEEVAASGGRLAGEELRRFARLRRQVDAMRSTLVPTAPMRVAAEGAEGDEPPPPPATGARGP
jgi:murein DD-endopeptidase MepM/ murein hydrolase activator NlpD